jgi:hypothetical protein
MGSQLGPQLRLRGRPAALSDTALHSAWRWCRISCSRAPGSACSEIPVATPVAIAATATATATVRIVVSPIALASARATLLIAATACARGLLAVLEAALDSPEPGTGRTVTSAASADIARLGAPLGLLLARRCPLTWIAARRRRPRSIVDPARATLAHGFADAFARTLATGRLASARLATGRLASPGLATGRLASARLALARFLHAQRAALHLVAVERRHGRLRFLGRGHLHEPESAGTPSLSIDDDRYVPHLAAAFREHGPQGLLIRCVREVANVELGTHRKVSVLVCELRVFATSASCA